jgi:hypothetical protein
MESLGADPVPINTISVDTDIAKYVWSELLRDRKLNRLEEATKRMLWETLVKNADRM